MPISQSQLQALTALIYQLRKDWDLPGIRAALTKAATLGTAADVAVAACRCASDLEMATPGLIPQPGQHWQGTTVAKRPIPVMCSEHSGHKAGDCRVCASLAIERPAYVVIPLRPRKRAFVPEEGS